jgi:hypothetical protein
MATSLVKGVSRALTVGAPIARNLTRKLGTASQVAIGQIATAPLPLSGRPNTFRAHQVLQNIGKFAHTSPESAKTQYTRKAGERKREPRRFNNDVFVMMFARDINIIEGWFRARGGRGGDHILNVIEAIDCIASGYVNEYRYNLNDFNSHNYHDVLVMFQQAWNAEYNRIPIDQNANNSLLQLVNLARRNHISLRQAWNQLENSHKVNIQTHQVARARLAAEDMQRGGTPIQLNINEPTGGIETLINHRRAVYQHVRQDIGERINVMGVVDQRMARNIFNCFERHYNKLMAAMSTIIQEAPIVIQGGVYPEESNEIINEIFTNQKLSTGESNNKPITVDDVDKSFKSIAKKVNLLSGYNNIQNSSTMIGSLKPTNILNKSSILGSLKPANILNKSSMLGSILLPGQRTSLLLPGYKYGGMKKQKKRRYTRKQKKRRN